MIREDFNIIAFSITEKIFGTDNTKKLLFCYNKRLLRNKIIFIHIPKAAGSSIANIVYGKRFGHFTISEYYKFLNKNISNDYFIFSVVRNPYRRLISAYNYAINGGTQEGSVKNKSKYRRKEFASFKNFVSDWLLLQDLENCELLFRTQSHFLCTREESRLAIQNVFKIENIEELSQELSKLLDSEIIIPHMNFTRKEVKLEEYYDEKTKEIVDRLYDADFRLLGYRKILE